MLNLAAFSFAVGLSLLSDASATYTDRIAAIVGDHVILMSEVRARAAMIARTQKMPLTQLTEAAFREVTERLVEEQLEQAEGERIKVAISKEEVDAALQTLADGNKMNLATLLQNAQTQGVTENELKDALRRQLLEGKLLRMRSNQMQRIEEKDLRARYEEVKRTSKDPKDLKSFDDLKQELLNDVLQERIAQLREDWLAQLKGRMYVEIRVGNAS